MDWLRAATAGPPRHLAEARGAVRGRDATTKEATVTVMQEGSGLADKLLERVAKTIGEKAMVSTVFGEPVEREGITVIPVAKARFGFGGGGGVGGREGQEGSGGGGGGGAAVSPLGYIEVRDGTARFRRITWAPDLLAIAGAVMLLALALRRLLTR